jgi:crotonobetainyl-CoA:carnitine CoA-transferase CaiB-like acyl-CoA transferase
MDELAVHPAVRDRQLTHTSPDGLLQPQPAPRLSRTPGKADTKTPLPEVGQHTRAVSFLREEGAVGFGLP